VQVIDPYCLWDHRHQFWPEASGTAMEDLVVYEPPYGPSGALVHHLAIRRQPTAIFQFRRERMQTSLGSEPNAMDGAVPEPAPLLTPSAADMHALEHPGRRT
jgi:hypothetical protein